MSRLGYIIFPNNQFLGLCIKKETLLVFVYLSGWLSVYRSPIFKAIGNIWLKFIWMKNNGCI